MNLGEWVRKGKTQALETINTSRSSFQMAYGSNLGIKENNMFIWGIK